MIALRQQPAFTPLVCNDAVESLLIKMNVVLGEVSEVSELMGMLVDELTQKAALETKMAAVIVKIDN